MKQLVSSRAKLIYVSFLVSFTNYVLYNTMLIDNTIKNGFRIVAIACLTLSFLFSRKIFTVNIKDIIVVTLLAVTLVTINLNPNLFNVGYVLVILIATKNIDSKKIMEMIFRATLIALIITFALLLAGIIEDVKYTIHDRTRHTFGFVTPNAFSGLLFSTIIMYVLSKGASRFRIALSVFLCLLFYMFTDSRTPTFAFLLFVAIFTFLRMFGRHINLMLIKAGFVTISFIPPLMSFLSPVLLKKFPQLDIISSIRLTINTNYIFKNNWINFLFGGTKATDIDNGYLTLSYSIGFVAFSLVFLFIIRVLLMAIKRRDYIIVAFIISFLLVNALEAWFLRPELAATIFFWYLIYNYSSNLGGKHEHIATNK